MIYESLHDLLWSAPTFIVLAVGQRDHSQNDVGVLLLELQKVQNGNVHAVVQLGHASWVTSVHQVNELIEIVVKVAKFIDLRVELIETHNMIVLKCHCLISKCREKGIHSAHSVGIVVFEEMAAH